MKSSRRIASLGTITTGVVPGGSFEYVDASTPDTVTLLSLGWLLNYGPYRA